MKHTVMMRRLTDEVNRFHAEFRHRDHNARRRINENGYRDEER